MSFLRRFEKSSEFEFDGTIADILAVPAKGEDALLDRVRKAGGDEEAMYAAAAYARVREAIPTAVLKAIDTKKLVPDAEDEEDELDNGDDEDAEAEANGEESVLATKKRKKAQLSKGDTVSKPTRTTEDVFASVVSIEKDIQIRDDAKAEQRVTEYASTLRRTNPSLSKAEAVVKAWRDSPDEYAAYQRHMMRQSGHLNDDPREVKKAQDADAILEEAGASLRRANPKLTKAQSIATALRLDPSLYGGN